MRQKLFSCLFFLLGGCQTFKQPYSEKIVQKGWGKTCPVKQEPYYCYNTLGESVCYTSPLPNAHHRLTGQPYLYKKVPIKKKKERICK